MPATDTDDATIPAAAALFIELLPGGLIEHEPAAISETVTQAAVAYDVDRDDLVIHLVTDTRHEIFVELDAEESRFAELCATGPDLVPGSRGGIASTGAEYLRGNPDLCVRYASSLARQLRLRAVLGALISLRDRPWVD